MFKFRRAFAITLVATTLCVDRGVMASVEASEAAPGEARSLVGRMSVALRRAVAGPRLYQPLRDEASPVIKTPAARRVAPAFIRRSITPFQFRLPPPLG